MTQHPILFVQNLPFAITNEEIYDLFGQFGVIRQVRLGNATSTKGKAYVVYESLPEARRALETLHGFSINGRFLVINFFHR